ncbi:DNA topoisomerase IV [Lacinutrix chionoecetis]
MKKLIFLFFSIFIFSCQQPERSCKDYKTGFFEFSYNDNGIEKTGYILRDNKLQIETYDNKIDSSEVRWINDCEVIFKTINPKRMVDKNDIHLKILSTTDSTYTFEYSYVGKSNKQKGIAKTAELIKSTK